MLQYKCLGDHRPTLTDRSYKMSVLTSYLDSHLKQYTDYTDTHIVTFLVICIALTLFALLITSSQRTAIINLGAQIYLDV